MERLKDLIIKNYENNKVENSNKILNKARKEVDINGNGYFRLCYKTWFSEG